MENGHRELLPNVRTTDWEHTANAATVVEHEVFYNCRHGSLGSGSERKETKMSEQQEKVTTLEGRAKTRNGVSRMIFAVIAIAIEIALVIIVVNYFDNSIWVQAGLRIFGLILVLAIYSQNKTSALKMPWIILIMTFPVLGVVLYLMIGLSGSTAAMKKRYAAIDEKLLPLLPENRTIQAQLVEQDPAAAGISSYIYRHSGYSLWKNTDIEYYDDATKGLEAQLEAMKKAESNIFGYCDKPLVSIDFTHDAHSSVFDATQTHVIDGNLVHVTAWYDNEWGFSNRMCDTAVAMGNLI